jgi:D-alanine--poly(phosphoribitol) ligase subunit 2
MNSEITAIILEALNDIESDIPLIEDQIDETPLYGAQGILDSLDLVNLIVAIESMINDKLNFVITLADEKAMSQKRSPFQSVGSLAQYIDDIMQEHTNG